MQTPIEPKKYNLVKYYNKVAQATLFWNLPYALIKFKKRIEENNKSHPKGTYFVPEENIKPK